MIRLSDYNGTQVIKF
uniref:Uncharacterized protein n=1 Tax=Zea mays TaxID=4577 RepID=C0HDU6_MAIZE|nr:unknown [Zea mays]